MSPSLTIIIPTLNEVEALPATLVHLKQQLSEDCEVIVVDGYSSDGTIELLKEYDVKILQSEPGRAAQLDFGARQAQGEYLCFLHADTLIPMNLHKIIERVFKDRTIVLAGFVSIMKGKRSRFLITFLNYMKTFLCPLFYRPYAFFFKGLRLLFGDQVMFCRKADYLKSGGFNPETKIMEEAELCLRMNKLGRIRQVHEIVYSSDRRVSELGLWKAMRIYIYIALGWAFGASTEKLSSRYHNIR